MAFYNKIWIPPFTHKSDDLPTWKAWAHDLHDNIIATGLGETVNSTLDIDAVASLPANGQYVTDYKEYTLNDDLQATDPVTIKIEYGVGNIGPNGSNGVKMMPRVRITVNYKGTDFEPIYCPQQRTDNSTTAVTEPLPGWSCFTWAPNLGFLGLIHGVSCFTSPGVNNNYILKTSSVSFFLQRTFNERGILNNEGVAIFGSNINANDFYQLYLKNRLPLAGAQYIDKDGNDSGKRTGISRMRGDGNIDMIGAKKLTQPINFFDLNEITAFPYIRSYVIDDIIATPKSTFVESTFFPSTGKYICLGKDVGLNVDDNGDYSKGVAMLIDEGVE